MALNCEPVPGAAAGQAGAPGHRLGSMIAGIFGLVYIEANAGSLPSTMALVVRALGVAGFLFVLLKLWRQGSDGVTEPAAGEEGFFRSGFWRIVALEAVGIVGGSAVMRLAGNGLRPSRGSRWSSAFISSRLPLSGG